MWLVRNFTSMETELVAVERLSECIALQSEAGTVGRLTAVPRVEKQKYGLQHGQQRRQLPRLCNREESSNAPSTGHILIRNLWMSYQKGTFGSTTASRENATSGLNAVLRGISVNIPASSKVAIVGRTGAGKSSLFLALQRLHPFTGRIDVDDIEGHLDDAVLSMRRAIAYVSQDPILFEGTVRSNLCIGLVREGGPQEHTNDVPSDEDLWVALRKVSMASKVRGWQGGLDAPVSSGGSNISAGERQMLCFARALLQRARVLLVDEGMSSVDAATDTDLHGTLLGLRGCTVLSIAHNLGALRKFDLVLVMEAGEIVEFGEPARLLHGGGEVVGDGKLLRELVALSEVGR